MKVTRGYKGVALEHSTQCGGHGFRSRSESGGENVKYVRSSLNRLILMELPDRPWQKITTDLFTLQWDNYISFQVGCPKNLRMRTFFGGDFKLKSLCPWPSLGIAQLQVTTFAMVQPLTMRTADGKEGQNTPTTS